MLHLNLGNHTNPTEFASVRKEKKTIEQLEEEEIPNYIEKKELVRLLQTATKQGLEMEGLIFLTLFYTGLRIGELVSLKLRDIDFSNQTISVTKTYYNAKTIREIICWSHRKQRSPNAGLP